MGTGMYDDLLRSYLESIGLTFRSEENGSGFYPKREPIAFYEADGIQYEVYDHI